MAPDLLRSRIPVLVSISNYFVALCNFSITFFFPMWFETVQYTSASVAGEYLVELISNLSFTLATGLHIAPNAVSMSLGSLFAGYVWSMHISNGNTGLSFPRWMMHRTGRYKTLNLVFGIFPTFAAATIASLDRDSNQFLQWFAVVRSLLPIGSKQAPQRHYPDTFGIWQLGRITNNINRLPSFSG